MARDIFTEGGRPGGLTTSTEVRVLLCYLMHSVPEPLSRDELEQALLGEELVNYFELADSLNALCDGGFAVFEHGRYKLLPAGAHVAAVIGDDLPRSVRELALRGAVRAQQFAQKAAQHKTVIEKADGGYTVHCSIEDRGVEMFSCGLFVPDEATAQYVRKRFIEHGDVLYALMLAGATGNRQLIETALRSAAADEEPPAP